LRKGVPWLLRAFSRLAAPVELHLVGPVERGMEKILRQSSLERVAVRGPLSGVELDRAYRDADIFCLPSIEEGFPLSCLQAMAMGLPIVVTPETGMTDAIGDGRGGITVPARDPVRLSAALEEFIVEPDRRIMMGRAARQIVEERYSWQKYGDRALQAYTHVLARSSASNPLALAKATG